MASPTNPKGVGTRETDNDCLNLGVDALGYLLWRVTLKWTRAASAALGPLRLTHAQFAILAGIWWLENDSGQPTQVELAAHAGTEARMTSELVEVLRQRGLVIKATDPRDHRKTRLAMTAAGETLAVVALETIQRLEREFFATSEHELGRNFLRSLI